ncbi:hypothetical protein G3I32_34905 [Streptomyces coelicoflavus]|uniref:NAD(P)H-binding protein n=1 Tax=Streptomyces coelicoflavus TaxID=285562 RepID=A0A7K3PVF5_9ACTN|nr:hypothetical protein [Streptomyces coelicoflavus]NEB13962.1 hypothetical protein [Streptomyces coelicoflavus]
MYTFVPEPVPANPAVVVADHAGTEQALRESGLRWTVLRNNLYAHLQTPVIEQAITTGRLVTNSGDGAAAYVAREDCATAAAAVLTRDGYEDRALDVTGPAAVTARDLADLAREIGGARSNSSTSTTTRSSPDSRKPTCRIRCRNCSPRSVRRRAAGSSPTSAARWPT